METETKKEVTILTSLIHPQLYPLLNPITKSSTTRNSPSTFVQHQLRFSPLTITEDEKNIKKKSYDLCTRININKKFNPLFSFFFYLGFYFY